MPNLRHHPQPTQSEQSSKRPREELQQTSYSQLRPISALNTNRSIAITPPPITSQVQPGSRARSSTTHASSASASKAKAATRGPGSFWTADGMDAFVDWITDPHNYEKLQRVRTVSGQKKADVHTAIAEYVNGVSGTDWTQKIVRNKIEYAKKKYDQAKALADQTGGGDTENLADLRRQMMEICPEYDRFHAVWGSSLARNPPPLMQSCRRVIDDSSERESSPETTLDSEDDGQEDDGNEGGFVINDLLQVNDEDKRDRVPKRRRKAKLSEKDAFVQSTVSTLQTQVGLAASTRYNA
ncbi:hypothetical protein BCR41DRAFT_44085 [Lobosporangium transversale]|uniref:Uncharacterized protein n=1 Tax=Lobosporangium transversale TaxID=64571 RepID=A0A1Y2GQX6_9FUNG|nr:hypothetical protein BCR41DRAFT_44085 [Lobosporangium transversale]ORZ18246.1 hypothetical protein BCR41DRAFT_44085 [Lobosporangium transversale]|eukprot:XP_021882041.1 hypothetical protein BCR41DRAFT_44085 [Lobosporangium transversale]